MRFAWTVAGDDPDFNQGDKHGINGYFYPMFDSLTTPAELTKAAVRGHVVGLYVAWNWPQITGRTPAQIVQAISAEYDRLLVAGAPKGMRLQYNDERHLPSAIIEVLTGLRERYRSLGLSWTPEGFQGGWMGPVIGPSYPAPVPGSFIDRLIKAKVRVVPQAYWGANGVIEGRFAEDQVLRNLTKRGIPESSVSLFYDARELPRNWDGYAFTMGQLPYIA